MKVSRDAVPKVAPVAAVSGQHPPDKGQVPTASTPQKVEKETPGTGFIDGAVLRLSKASDREALTNALTAPEPADETLLIRQVREAYGQKL